MIEPADLDAMEDWSFKEESTSNRYLQKCILEIRDLNHQLKHPNYMYAGSRICRNAILSRNMELNHYCNELIELKNELHDLKQASIKKMEEEIQKGVSTNV